MTTPQARFKGTEEEAIELINAINNNCECSKPMGVLVGDPCLPHLMMVDQQRQLDGLVVSRRRRERLIFEEWLGIP